MKATELRIGNLIHVAYDGINPKTKLKKVNLTTLSGALRDYNNISYKPIPLTEEWLLKFGFYRVENGYYGSMPYNKPCWIKFSFTILIWDDGTFVYDWNGGNTILKSVHQLQNLHFALKGKELTIKS